VSKPRLLFYVQHLLGIGHLRRAATLTRWLQAGGLDVTLVSGGFPVPGLKLAGARLVQLPPTRATDELFKQLVDAEDRPIDDAWRARRSALLLETFDGVAPDAVLFELFPFGRRQMRFELLPLIERIKSRHPRPLILCSVRDILVGQHKPGREREMLDLVRAHFDHVLVHGDPAFIPFDRTFRPSREIADLIAYTGYVVDETAGQDPGADGADEVLVSAGGGAVGARLLEAAIDAKPHTLARHATWRVLVGAAAGDGTLDRLRAKAGAGVIVEPARADFPTLLHRCRLSISQGGYNTLMETLAARARAVVVPYAGGIETEQTLRSQLLAERGLIETLAESALSPLALAAAVDRALAGPAPGVAVLDTGGGPRSAAMIRRWIDDRAAR